jgi:hypothetical protein
VTYVQELGEELHAVGIRGRLRRRILLEVDDHLREDAAGVHRFGAPAELAAKFADELATSGARRGAVAAFLALAPIGVAYSALLLSMRPGPDITSAEMVPLGVVAALVLRLAPQVAFASGVLALLRAWQLRTSAVAPAATVRVLRRRAGVALAAGAATLAATAVYAVEYRAGLPGWWQYAALAMSAGGTVVLAGATSAIVATAGIRSQAAGTAGDVFDDMAPLVDRLPLRLRGHPWRFCLLFAAGVAVLALLGGGLGEGPRNAVGEFAAICAGFAVLGRFLGLRR